MTTINNLSAQDTISAGDQFAVYSNGNGDTRRVSATALAVFLQSLISSSGFQTQYAAPSATGQTTIVTPLVQGGSVWLQMNPLGAYAAGTLTLPAAAVSVDGQKILVTTTQAVTTLTVNYLNASGVSVAVVGAPATLAANSWFEVCYDPVFKAWIRIG